MKILYGIVGEGMGHATRSSVLIENLLEKGHEVRIVVSGRAHGYIANKFQQHPHVQIHEIRGFELDFTANQLQIARTFIQNLKNAPKNLKANAGVYRQFQAEGYRPDVVFSDFESWARTYATRHRIPLISIDNQQIIPRCAHAPEITNGRKLSYHMANWVIQAKMPRAYHYLVTSFFFPPVAHERTTLVPPILRPHVLQAKREPGSHILVYQTQATNPVFLKALRDLPYSFRVYGTGKDEQQGNLSLRPFSETGFIDDLRTARAVIANSGFSLLGEAVHLRVPTFTVPLRDQFEQEINARYLQLLGYGVSCDSLQIDAIQDFLANTRRYERALRAYRPRDNSMLFDCVDELLHHIQLDEPPPVRLHAKAMAKFYAPPLPEERLAPSFL